MISNSLSTGRKRLWRGAALAALIAPLAACEDGTNPFAAFLQSAGTPAADSAAQSVELVETDVEAPEVFQLTAEGLWDGRPSLGGVWVAHPDVTDPERVIIRNQENGTFVIGALFRRERENPGPALQVSSDAAEALGMLAGAPAELNVTALRRQEAAEPVPTEESDPVGTGAAVEPLGAPDDITAAPLDPAPGGAAPLAPAGADEAAAPVEAPVEAPVASADPAPSPPAPVSSPLSRPFIQLGIFSIEANAQATARLMEQKGLAVRVLQQQSQGRTFWRVIVGPAQSEAERAGFLERVQAEGFADAYFVAD